MGALQVAGQVGIAVGPPLAYLDQFINIIRKRSSAGFSQDICGVLIVANVTRVFYWLGERFQTALLVQSLLMILAQFALLYVCLLYKSPTEVDTSDARSAAEGESLTGGGSKESGKSTRVGQLWQWKSFGSYVESIALLVVFHVVTFLILHSYEWYVTALGFFALGLEATLPIPQLLVNFERKSTFGFRWTVLLGWAGGDAVKTAYFFATDGNSVSFKACALFQLSVDVLLVIQTYMYSAQTKQDTLEFAEAREAGEATVFRAPRDREEDY